MSWDQMQDKLTNLSKKLRHDLSGLREAAIQLEKHMQTDQYLSKKKLINNNHSPNLIPLSLNNLTFMDQTA